MIDKNIEYSKFALQIIFIFVLLFFLILLLKIIKTINYDKRLNKFSLNSIKDIDKSFLDKLYDKFWQLIKRFSKRLYRLKFMIIYSKSFDKYLSYEEKFYKDEMDLITIKFFIGFGLIIFYIVNRIISLNDFNILTELICFLLGFFSLDLILYLKYRKKRKQVEEDLLKAIVIMNNAFKSGRNIIQAVEIVKDQLEGPISDEFKKIYLDMNYGLSVEIVFNRFYNRVKLEDAKYITSSLSLLNKTGGNIVRVFNTIEKTFYNKKKLRDELKSMTASSTLVYRILLLMPFVISLIIIILNPEYFKPLYTTTLGVLCIIIISILLTIYIYTVKKVMKVLI